MPVEELDPGSAEGKRGGGVGGGAKTAGVGCGPKARRVRSSMAAACTRRNCVALSLAAVVATVTAVWRALRLGGRLASERVARASVKSVVAAYVASES